MKSITRRDLREQTADDIKTVSNFGTDGEIEASVRLIRHALEEKRYDDIEKHLAAIEKSCKLNYSRDMQNYHAFEMMRHFALAIGERYDPMY